MRLQDVGSCLWSGDRKKLHLPLKGQSCGPGAGNVDSCQTPSQEGCKVGPKRRIRGNILENGLDMDEIMDF